MKKYLKTAVFIVAIGFLIIALVKYGPALMEQVVKADRNWLAAAFVLCIVYRIVNAAGWGLVLRAMGHPIPTGRGIRLWLISETMRWLPGSVWGFASRVYQATEAGVPSRIASLSMPVELILTVVAWSVTAAAGMIFSGVGTELLAKLPIGAIAAGLAIPVVLVGVLLCLPDNKFARKVRSFGGDLKALTKMRPDGKLMALTTVFYVGLCVLNGLAFWALLKALTATAPSFMAATGINAVGWLVGFFAIASPGGLGVREGGMTVLLTPLTGLPVAVASVVLWRGMQLVVELICLAGSVTPGMRFTAPAEVETAKVG